MIKNERRKPHRGDGGFSAMELVVITPVFLAMLLLIVGFGRVTHGRQVAEQAASAAARAATLDMNPVQAAADARQQANDVLTQAGVSCASFTADVDVSDFRAGGQVTVTVRCVTSLARLGLVGFPGAKTLQASSTSPIEDYRQIDGIGP